MNTYEILHDYLDFSAHVVVDPPATYESIGLAGFDVERDA